MLVDPNNSSGPYISLVVLSGTGQLLESMQNKIKNKNNKSSQLVERWTPGHDSPGPGVRVRVRDATALDIYETPGGDGCGRGSGRSQMKPVSGTDRARLCGCVKLWNLNSAVHLELPDRRVGGMANATSSA